MNVKVTSISVVTCIKRMSFITHQTIYLVAENQRPGNFKMSFIYQMQPQTLAFTYTDDSHCMRSQRILKLLWSEQPYEVCLATAVYPTKNKRGDYHIWLVAVVAFRQRGCKWRFAESVTSFLFLIQRLGSAYNIN